MFIWNKKLVHKLVMSCMKGRHKKDYDQLQVIKWPDKARGLLI